MAYIGNTPAEFYQTLEKQSFTTSATTTYTLNFSVTNPQEIALFINNIRQNPNSSYTVSNLTTLTLSSATSSSDVMYAVFLGKSVGTIAPPLNSVTTGMLLDNAVTTPKIIDNAVTSAKIIDNAVTSAKIVDNAVTSAKLAPGAGGIEWQSSIITGATVTVQSNKAYWIDTTSNVCTVTLPSSATVGDSIQLVDYAGTFATNNITLTSSAKINGITNNHLLTTKREGVTITFANTTQGWVATSGVNSGTQALEGTYAVDFLVIAGGGSGGGRGGGGGGAGGYRNSFSTETSGGGASSEASASLSVGTSYTVTVGAGGAFVSNGDSYPGNSGNNSVFGSITSIAGGGGAQTGLAGGSGGGGSAGNAGGAGTSGQGFAGGTGAGSGTGRSGAGGGGASVVGANASSGVNGNGGNGLASSITASAVTRGGGGGGGSYNTGYTLSQGGTGGGGNGIANGGYSGTANTGSGGAGGTGTGNDSGAGGSGVVILRMATANYTGTTSGSPTVSQSGTDTILVYNASGSYTA